MEAAVVMEVHAACGTQTVAKAAEIDRFFPGHDAALSTLKLFVERIESNGEWDDGCFYYGGRSASELQEPLLQAREIIAKATA
jgi:hypothetical protein